jgi:hypothetical protein
MQLPRDWKLAYHWIIVVENHGRQESKAKRKDGKEGGKDKGGGEKGYSTAPWWLMMRQ